MNLPKSVRELIALWPEETKPIRRGCISVFAGDVGQAVGTVTKWRDRNSIPPGYWPAICRAAQSRNIEQVSPEVLVAIHPEEPRRADAPEQREAS